MSVYRSLRARARAWSWHVHAAAAAAAWDHWRACQQRAARKARLLGRHEWHRSCRLAAAARALLATFLAFWRECVYTEVKRLDLIAMADENADAQAGCLLACLRFSVCVSLSLSLSLSLCLSLSLSLCIYVSMYLCIYLCMYLYKYIFISI